MENNNIFAKMNVVRTELSKNLEKSGKNDYSHYDYFQLADFIPTLLKLCNDNGLFTQFWIGRDKVELPSKVTRVTATDEEGKTIITETTEENFQYVEQSHLVVYDVETQDTIEFTKETRECSLSAAQPIQNLGSKTTYMKRYMYMDAFEIVENDKIEESTGAPEPKVEKKVTKSSKPKVTEVKTQPEVYATTDMGVPMGLPIIENTPTAEAIIEASVEVASEVQTNTEDLMSMETKIMLANKIKEAGLDPREEIMNMAKELGTDVPFLKESDKDKILEILNKKVGK